MSTPPKVKKALNGLLRDPGNSFCADCKNSSHPRWASWSLGVFVCIKCAGVHRSLGTHISKVKSVDLDIWQEEHLINLVKMRSNREANKIFEAKTPEELRRPILDTNKLQNFIRNKYEHKKWIGTPKETATESPPAEASPTPLSMKSGSANELISMEDHADQQNNNTHSTSSSVLNLQLLSMPKVKETVSEGQSQTTNASTPSTASRRTGISERPDLKKSILSLYAKPQGSRSSMGTSTESVATTTTPNLASPTASFAAGNGTNASTSSLEDNELFKNVWT
ncbi:hypothetical protein ZYGR_0N07130 [Zygosaccharomyces rouxii]|uniref:ZYRO0D16676p n=2 Tax=Zygosaccharomyces rouxii TaxID=4956 RepID=C5DWQ2_ZYGRC|nr:uncharacterized protein ZYRO0D16676g [Zygosaccharomyces rouxii]KAH9201131.1 putative GTPase activating protein for Arf-domain-containing protein [Zygosaccharomyces rouxii]GAV49306.1 hypothetical protein ZYGR_0N07130 [Zygosaccharomyces rouxii]CAR28221.1 ZYRO0D16676p [Zygosaccharomyces rouxii]